MIDGTPERANQCQNNTLLNKNKSLLQSTIFPHLFCAEVGVAAGTIPVPWDRFGVKGGHHSKVLTDSVKNEASHPQVITHVDTFTRSNLELPLEVKTDRIYVDKEQFL